uniref:DNA topoisomerase type IA zn finger domain-containing protein n=1 Tax=Alloyangia mangrovi TaxID=1779329 RepID=A0A2A3JPQ8_9RHOB
MLTEIKSNLKEKVLKEKEVSKQKVCPKCSGELSLKKGKYGSFYGCSNFPKCRYTKQVS